MYMLIVRRGYLSCVGEGGFNVLLTAKMGLSSVFSVRLERGFPFVLNTGEV